MIHCAKKTMEFFYRQDSQFMTFHLRLSKSQGVLCVLSVHHDIHSFRLVLSTKTIIFIIDHQVCNVLDFPHP